ncbi:hypothetical protein Tco_0884930 [Tanacetum coccineum]
MLQLFSGIGKPKNDRDGASWSTVVGIKRLRGDLEVTAAKLMLLALRPGEYENLEDEDGTIHLDDDYSLWEVIENGNAPLITKVVEGVETTIAPTTAEEKAQRRLLESSEVLDQTFDRLQKLISHVGEFMVISSSQRCEEKFLRSLVTRKGTTYHQVQMAMLTMRAMRFLKNTRRKHTVIGIRVCEARLLVYKKNEYVYKEDIKIVDKCKTGLGYNAVPPPYTRNFMPPKPNLSFSGLEDFISEPIVIKPVAENSEANASEAKPKAVRKNNSALIIED